jgi:hypothetical protein
MRRIHAVFTLALLGLISTTSLLSQSLGNAGTIEGTVLDPSGAAVAGAVITIHNLVTQYSQSATASTDGSFRLSNIPPNPYHLEITAPGFDTFAQDVSIRGVVPVQVNAKLAIAGASTSVTVEGAGADMLEIETSAHSDADRQLIEKLPVSDPGSGLSQAITYSTGAVAADGNGFFHPLGDHSQVSFNIDGQRISDQQSKVFSTQLPANAIQSMELVTGTPRAEFGGKTSLVANITTRSGLGGPKFFGNVDANYGSFGEAGGSVGLGLGGARSGNFLAVDGVRSGRFFDSPEYTPFHDIGNNQTIFDRFDLQPSDKDSVHLNLFTARNWTQIPNSYDQLGQDQRQRVFTWSVAPGYQRTINPHTLFTLNPYIRKDEFFYYGSRDPFADTPATQNQARQLLNWGVSSDLSWTHGAHSVKAGIDLKQTRLHETFGFGITSPDFNPVCVDASGSAAGAGPLSDPAGCGPLGFSPNPAFNPGLLPFDLTRGGAMLAFHGAGNVNEYGFYVQDQITAGNFLFTPGLRIDRYDGIGVSSTGISPRLGIAYNIKSAGTVLRAAYARTLETPFNENLLLSSQTGTGGLDQNVFGGNATPIEPGRRNQFNAGIQQALGRYLLLDGAYFWKYTHGAFDFSTLLNTTITFPISWHNSKTDGVTGRISTTNLRGFQAYWTFGHTRARYFPPEVGGLIAQGTALSGGVFRIDHDQALQSTSVLRYQFKKAEWISFTWRYDSGLVVSGVPDSEAALALTPNQQATIGLACGSYAATYTNGGLSPALCGANPVTSKLITLPQAGEQNDDHNPDRVKPRNVFNLGIGTDNLLHTEKTTKLTASLEITNLTNKVAVYNFLSTFSGTHFLEPRAVVAKVGLVF